MAFHGASEKKWKEAFRTHQVSLFASIWLLSRGTQLTKKLLETLCVCVHVRVCTHINVSIEAYLFDQHGAPIGDGVGSRPLLPKNHPLDGALISPTVLGP